MKKYYKHLKYIVFIYLIGHNYDVFAQTYCTVVSPIYRQSQLDSLKILYPTCENIEGLLLYFEGITSLESLSYLKRIRNIYVVSTNITSLKGLENVSIKNIQLINNKKMNSLDLFPKIENKGKVVLERLNIDTLPSIELDELEYLSLSSCANLTNVDKIKIGKGSLYIEFCDKLNVSKLCNKFSNIHLLRLSLHKGSLSKIKKMSINVVEVSKCQNIDDLTFLDSLVTSNSLTFIKNPSLQVCATEKVCQLIQQGSKFEIYDNAPGCNSFNEVKALCLSSNGLVSGTNITCYPNPSWDKINIYSDVEIKNIRLFDLAGNEKVLGTNTNGKKEIDTSTLSQGLYILQLTDLTSRIYIRKILKL